MTPEHTSGERRCALRIPVSLEAVLYHNSLMLNDCTVRDISADGMFVLTGGQRLPDGAQVDLVLSAVADRDNRRRIGAEVMRVTDEGVGLRLKYGDPIQMRALVDMLYAA
jgi:hypothetical protein